MTEKEAEKRRERIEELQRQLHLAADEKERRMIESQIAHLSISIFGYKREKGKKGRSKGTRGIARSR